MFQVAEKAIVYFERAALMQPDEVKWHLMIGNITLFTRLKKFFASLCLNTVCPALYWMIAQIVISGRNKRKNCVG